MNVVVNEAGKERPLRFVHPDCYSLLLKELDVHHLHPYDIKANARWEEDGILISLQYGEGMRQTRVQNFPEEAINRLDPGIMEFFRDAAEECKSTIIADYFKIMKP